MSTFSKMQDSKFSVRRKHVRFFKKTFTHQFKKHTDMSSSLKGQILNLFNDWVKDKGEKMTINYSQHEFLALSRFLEASEIFSFLIIGIYYYDRLIAASLSESTTMQYNLSHFQKAINSNFKGLNIYLVHEVANLLEKEDIKYINWEQDLGIPGLRKSKTKYRPDLYLNKFIIKKHI